MWKGWSFYTSNLLIGQERYFFEEFIFIATPSLGFQRRNPWL
jgi:hypothetical protein